MNAIQQRGRIDPAKLPRDHAIARMRMLGNNQDARKQWKKEMGYNMWRILSIDLKQLSQIN